MQPDEVETWKRALLSFRDAEGRVHEDGDTTLPSRARARRFPGLRYFEPDPAFRFDARLQ